MAAVSAADVAAQVGQRFLPPGRHLFQDPQQLHVDRPQAHPAFGIGCPPRPGRGTPPARRRSAPACSLRSACPSAMRWPASAPTGPVSASSRSARRCHRRGKFGDPRIGLRRGSPRTARAEAAAVPSARPCGRAQAPSALWSPPSPSPAKPSRVIEDSHSSSSRLKRFCPWPANSSSRPSTSDPASPRSEEENAVPIPPSWLSSPPISLPKTSSPLSPSCGARLRIVSTTAGTVVARPQKVPRRPRKISRLIR